MQDIGHFYTYFAKSTLQNQEYLQIFSTLYCIVLEKVVPLQSKSKNTDKLA